MSAALYLWIWALATTAEPQQLQASAQWDASRYASSTSNRVRVQPAAPPLWHLLWRQPTVRTGHFRQVRQSFGQPAISTRLQRVIVGTAQGEVVAYRLGGGTPIWRYHYGAPLEAAAFLIDSGGPQKAQERVVIGTRDGILLALDVATGALVWRADIDGEVRAAPRLAEGLLIITTSANKVSALQPDTGQVVWTHGRAAPTGLTVEGHARAAIAGDRVFVSFSDGFGAAFSLQDGQLLWGRPLSLQGGSFVDADADPIVVGQQVFMASYADGIYALDVADGQTLWNRPAPDISTLAWAQGRLVAGSAQGVVWGLHPANGTVLWSVQLEAQPLSRLLVQGEHLLFTAGTAGLIVLDACEGRPLQASGLGEQASNDPTQAGTFLSFVSNAGYLYLWQQEGVTLRAASRTLCAP